MKNHKTVHVKYFALLREQAGVSKETLTTDAPTLKELYQELSMKHQFSLDISLVRASVNAQYQNIEMFLTEGDEIVFIPPVAGG